jgi:hypothetical protein
MTTLHHNFAKEEYGIRQVGCHAVLEGMQDNDFRKLYSESGGTRVLLDAAG